MVLNASFPVFQTVEVVFLVVSAVKFCDETVPKLGNSSTDDIENVLIKASRFSCFVSSVSTEGYFTEDPAVEMKCIPPDREAAFVVTAAAVEALKARLS